MASCIEVIGKVHWRPGIGDPTVMGWVTVVCYFAAAYLCAWAAKSVRRAGGAAARGGSPAFWVILAVLFVILGINKQLDLQTLFTQIGKEVAKLQGWYDQRHSVQNRFVTYTAILGVASAAFFAVLIRRALLRQWLALAGAIFLICFIIIRASSFHSVDHALGRRLGGMRLNWVLELAGILCVGISAILNIRWSRNHSKDDPDARSLSP